MKCPHCGFEISEKRKAVKKPRRRRLPNGFGSITEIKGRRLAKPYLARVTVGKDKEGKPILKSLKPYAYFKTYNDAYSALLKYNKNPYDLDSDMSVKELYDRWIEVLRKDSATGNVNYMTSAFEYCTDVYDMKVVEIRARHIKHCIENGTVIIHKGVKKGQIRHTNPGTKERIKILWNNMLDYALEYELVEKNYARTFALSSKVYEEQRKNKREHLPFSEGELVKLWSLIKTEPVAPLIIIQCYTGFRPNELLAIRRTDVDIENRTIKGGSKTEAGKNRVVPIHSAILPLVKSYYNKSKNYNSQWLFNTTDSRIKDKHTYKQWKYHKYARELSILLEKYHFDPNHRPHDPRKTFVTEAKRFGIDDNVIKILIGHAIKDITESVYTQRDLEWLRKDLEKIKIPIKNVQVVDK